MTAIKRIALHNFRNHYDLTLEDLDSRFIALIGPNGVGKTNILEAISLFAPGKGFRRASLDEILRKDMKENGVKKGDFTPSPSAVWSVALQLDTDYGMIPMGLSYDPAASKKIMRLKGEDVRAQAAFDDYISILWLVPQMDGLFLGPASERRRFFDRMIYSCYDRAHAGRITRYDNAMRQRAKILSQPETAEEKYWLEGLEREMAETAVAIAAGRLDFIYRLNAACRKFAQHNTIGSFPLGSFEAKGTVEVMLAKQMTAVEIEEHFMKKLSSSRMIDSIRGGAMEGPHKSDFLIRHIEKDMPAEQCSTGEQKALLTGIILAYARMLKDEHKIVPILLLDEIAAHFDENRRKELFELLASIGGQIWMSGTDGHLFDHDQIQKIML